MENLGNISPKDIRQKIRCNEYRKGTAGVSDGFLQGNVVILPAEHAGDFYTFCKRNPKPCPLIGLSKAGDPSLPMLGGDIDIRTDVPKYRVFKDGVLQGEEDSVEHLWRDDLVTFVLGCSLSFEMALMDDGVPIRHIEQDTNVPMYRTNVPTNGVGNFTGNLVVSMRPLTVPDTIKSIAITNQFDASHGAPVHFGSPSDIGIDDIHKNDYGDPVHINDNEIPVFWACGVTPQNIIANAKPSLCITHAPGHMLITDVKNEDGAIYNGSLSLSG